MSGDGTATTEAAERQDGPRKERRHHARREPYTEAGVRRLPCFRCGEPAEFQWSVCATGNRYHPLCRKCDVGLNEIVLEWMGHPDRKRLIAKYRAEKGEPCAV